MTTTTVGLLDSVGIRVSQQSTSLTLTTTTSRSDLSLGEILTSSSPSESTSSIEYSSSSIATSESTSLSADGFMNPASSSESSSMPLSSTVSTLSTSATSTNGGAMSASAIQSHSNTSSSTTAVATAQAASQPTSKLSWVTIPTFAGIVAGSFVVGALIAGLFVFVLLKRRSKPKKHAPQSKYMPSHYPAYGGEKALAVSTVTTLAEPTFLPQQVEDAEIGKRILSLTDQIDQHIENFYLNRRVYIDGNVEDKISQYETQQMPNPLATCFESAATPLVLLKHCLAFQVFSRTVSPGEDAKLLLPAEISNMVAAVYHKCLSPTVSSDTISAFSMWKSLTGYLHSNRQISSGNRWSAGPSDEAMKFARSFSAAFSEWADAQHDEYQRLRHLAALIDQAIDTGTWIFQQPDTFRFRWNTLSYCGRNSATNMIAREAVIVPEVSKLTHTGVRLSGSGVIVVDAVVRSF